MDKKYCLCLLVMLIVGFFYHSDNLKPSIIKDYPINMFMYKERLAIKNEGDTTAYKLYIDSIYKNKHVALSNSFIYSLRMAIIHNYTPANYDAYRTISVVYPRNMQMDSETKRLSIFLLKRGADRGDKRCLLEIKKMKIKYKEVPCSSKEKEDNLSLFLWLSKLTNLFEGDNLKWLED